MKKRPKLTITMVLGPNPKMAVDTHGDTFICQLPGKPPKTIYGDGKTFF